MAAAISTADGISLDLFNPEFLNSFLL